MSWLLMEIWGKSQMTGTEMGGLSELQRNQTDINGSRLDRGRDEIP
jgi:hypothetical protein